MKKRWYMISAISGKEQMVVESIKNKAIAEGLSDDFEDFQIMYVYHLTDREREKKSKGLPYKIGKKNLFPGYIYVKADMTSEVWSVIRNTEYVTGIIGSFGQKSKPTPVSEVVMQKMFENVKALNKAFEDGKIPTNFKEGTIVYVTDGPYKGQTGKIIENFDDKEYSIVELILFERKTPTEIEHKNLTIKK